ncbi:ABC transporter permease [Bacillus gobiensis]|uniref:ABC transporter permease n=1 Tax=Bacillus gobiensis TaxID=1441095 RepID=UPI003D1D3C22
MLLQNGKESEITGMQSKTTEYSKTIKRKPASWLEPQKDISAKLYLSLSVASFLIFIGIWALLTYSGVVNPLFLPSPSSIIESGITLFTSYGFFTDIYMTLYRVLVGFILAFVIGMPLGLLIGSYKAAEAFFEPMVSFVRYMPISAFIPLFILWIGVGELEKVAIIFFGSLFSIILMIAVEVSSTRKELVEAAYTLGSSNFSVVRSVILPASIPGIMDTARLVLGWAWTYIVIAELIAAKSGIGSVILESQRMLQTGNIIFGILTIGTMGLISDLLLKKVSKIFFAWNDGR